jgi:hypothetical protein
MIVLKSTSSLQDFMIGETSLSSAGRVSESLVGSDSMDRIASGVDLGILVLLLEQSPQG